MPQTYKEKKFIKENIDRNDTGKSRYARVLRNTLKHAKGGVASDVNSAENRVVFLTTKANCDWQLMRTSTLAYT